MADTAAILRRHTPQVPLEEIAATPVVAIGAIAALLIAAGFAGLGRRDIGY